MINMRYQEEDGIQLSVLVTWFGYGHSTLRAHVKDTDQNDEAAQTNFTAGVIEKDGNI